MEIQFNSKKDVEWQEGDIVIWDNKNVYFVNIDIEQGYSLMNIYGSRANGFYASAESLKKAATSGFSTIQHFPASDYKLILVEK